MESECGVPVLLVAIICYCLGCQTTEPVSKSVETDSPPAVRSGANSTTIAPNLTSPEGFNRLLEQRWSLADVRTFCIPARRHNPAYQNLVATGEVWRGRLYVETNTGFDHIGWYAVIEKGQIYRYSLSAERGSNYWLLELGGPESLSKPPKVAPDPTAPHFLGHNTDTLVPR